MDEAGSLSGLEGQDWSKWMRRLGRDRPEDDLNGVAASGPASPAASKPSAHCKRLAYQDHLLFGHCPEVDPFVAAVCEFCGAIVKIPFLQQHIESRHNEMLRPKLKIKAEPVAVKAVPPAVFKAEKPPTPQAPTSKVSLLPVMGKQSILVAAAARFAEAPLSPPKPPPVAVPVPEVAPRPEKGRKRGRASKTTGSTSTDAPEKRRRVDSSGGYNPDIHCGVWNEQTKTNCLRALTCRIHSLVLKRAVPMRTSLFDDLLAKHKVVHKVKKTNSLDEEREVLVEDDESCNDSTLVSIPTTSTVQRPNGLTITGSFAKVEISLDEFPVTPSEFLPLSFPRLSTSGEITKKPLPSADHLKQQQQHARWPTDFDPLPLRQPVPKPLMVCNTSNLRRYGGYLGVQRGLQVLRRKFQCLVHAKENANEEIKFDYLGFPPASVELTPAPPRPAAAPAEMQPASLASRRRHRWRRRAVVARRLRQAKARYRLQLVRHRKHKHHRAPAALIVKQTQPQPTPQQVQLNKKRKAGSYKENSSLNGTKPGESLLVSNRAAIGLLSSRPHSALGDAAAAHPSTASPAIGSQMEADTLRATKSKGALIRLSDLADSRNHKSGFATNQTMVTVQQVPRVLASQMMPMPGEASSLKFLPSQSKTLFSFSKKDHEKT